MKGEGASKCEDDGKGEGVGGEGQGERLGSEGASESEDEG